MSDRVPKRLLVLFDVARDQAVEDGVVVEAVRHFEPKALRLAAEHIASEPPGVAQAVAGMKLFGKRWIDFERVLRAMWPELWPPAPTIDCGHEHCSWRYDPRHEHMDEPKDCATCAALEKLVDITASAGKQREGGE